MQSDIQPDVSPAQQRVDADIPRGEQMTPQPDSTAEAVSVGRTDPLSAFPGVPVPASLPAPVMLLVTGLSVGGAERVVLNLGRALGERGHRVVVVGMTGGDELLSMVQAPGLEVRHLHMKRTPLAFFKAVLAVRAMLRHEDIRVIHAHLPHAAMVAMTVKATMPRVQVAFTSHSFGGLSRFQTLLFRWTRRLRAVDVLLGAGQHPQINAARHVIVPNGIEVSHSAAGAADASGSADAAGAAGAAGAADMADAADAADAVSTALRQDPAGAPRIRTQPADGPSLAPSTTPDPFVFLYVGSLNAHKNPLGLVDAFQLLRSRRPRGSRPMELRMAGVGPQSQELKAAVERLGLEDVVELLGVRSDVTTIMNAADCLVIPSHYEGLPMVALEAGGQSLPIVAPPVGAMPALLADGCGYLARSNEPEDLAQAMVDVLDDVPEAARRAARFRERVVQRYSHRQFVDEHLRLYATLH